MDMKKYLAIVPIALILAFLAAYTVNDYLNLPTVAFSHSTGECVWIAEYPDFERRECDYVPSRYHMEYVK